jgi:GTPase SAR1 family protein
MSKKSKSAKKEDFLKVFRLTLLGRAESGKSSLCGQFISNMCNPRYEHTNEPHMYYREIRPKDVMGMKSSSHGGTSSGNPKHAKKKKKPEVVHYGVQLEDTPGEISNEVSSDSFEKSIIEDNGPKDYLSSMLAEDDENANETSALLAKEKLKNSKRNRLFAPSPSHGYIILFDASNVLSMKKAFTLHKAVLNAAVKKNLPIVLLGNKIDNMKSGSGDVLDQAKAFCRKYKKTKLASSSLNRNEIFFQDKVMTTSQLIHATVQILNEGGHFLQNDESDRRDKRSGKSKRRGGDQGNAVDEEMEQTSWCSCFGGNPEEPDNTDAEGMQQ